MIQQELTLIEQQLKEIKQLKQSKMKENKLLIPEQDLQNIKQNIMAELDPTSGLENSSFFPQCITQMDCCGYTMIYYLGIESKFDNLLNIFTWQNLPLHSNICFFLLKSIIQIKNESTYPTISKFLKDLRLLDTFQNQIKVFKQDQAVFNSIFIISHFNLQQLWDLKLYKSIVKLLDLDRTTYIQPWLDHYAKQGKIPKNWKVKSSYMNKYNLFHQFLDLKKWDAFIQVFSEQQFEKDHFGSIAFGKFLRCSPQEFIQKYFNKFSNQLSQTLQQEQNEKKKNYFLHDLLQNQSLQDDFLVEFINQNGEDQRRLIYRDQYPIGTYLSVKREFQNQKIAKYLTISTEDNTYFIQLLGVIQRYECKVDLVQKEKRVTRCLKELQTWKNNVLGDQPFIFQLAQDHYFNNLQVAKILFNNQQTNLKINYSMPLAYVPFEQAQQFVSFINLLVRRGFNEQAQIQLQNFLNCNHKLTEEQQQFIIQSLNRTELESIEKLQYQIKIQQLLSLLNEENMSIQLRSYVIEQIQEMIAAQQDNALTIELLECYNIYQKQKLLKNLQIVSKIKYKINPNYDNICEIRLKKLLFYMWPYLDIKQLENIKQLLINLLKNNINKYFDELLKISINEANLIWLIDLAFNNLNEQVEDNPSLEDNYSLIVPKKLLFSQTVFEHLLKQNIYIGLKRKLVLTYLDKFQDYDYQLLYQVLPPLELPISKYKLIYCKLIKKQNIKGLFFFLRFIENNQPKNKITINQETYKMINFRFAAKLHWTNGLSNQELIQLIQFHETQLEVPFTQEEKCQAIVNICLNYQSAKLKTIINWIQELDEKERYQLFFSVLIRRLVQYNNYNQNIFRMFPKPEEEPGVFTKALAQFKSTAYQPFQSPLKNSNLSHTSLFQNMNVEESNFDETIEFLEQFIDSNKMKEQKELYLLYVYLKPQFDYDIMTPVNDELLLIQVIYLTVRMLGKCKLQQQYREFIRKNKKYLKEFIEIHQQDDQQDDSQKVFLKNLNKQYNYITQANEQFYHEASNKSISQKIFRHYEKIKNLISELKITNYQTYIEDLYKWIQNQNSPFDVIKQYDFLYFFTTHSTDQWVVKLLKLIDISQLTQQELEYQGEPILSAIVFKKLYNTYKILEKKIAYQWNLNSKTLILHENVIKKYDEVIKRYFNYNQINMTQKALLNGFLVNLNVDNLSVYIQRTKQFLLPPDPYYLNSNAYQIYLELSKINPEIDKNDLEIFSLNLTKYADSQYKDKVNQEQFQEILLQSAIDFRKYKSIYQQNDIMSQSEFSIQKILHTCKCRKNIVNLICELYNIIPTKSYPFLHQIFSQFKVDLSSETLYSLCNHYEGIYHPLNKLLIKLNLELFYNVETLGSLEYTCLIGLKMNQLEFEKNFLDLQIPDYSLYQVHYQILLIIMMIRFDLNFEINKENIQLASCVKALNIIQQSKVNQVKFHQINHFKKLENLLLEGDNKDYIIQFLIAQFGNLQTLEAYFEMIIYIQTLDLQRVDICNLILAQSNFLLKYQPFQVNFGDQNKITEFTVLCTINHNNQWFNHELDEYLVVNDRKFQIFIKQYLKKLMKIQKFQQNQNRILKFNSQSKAFYKDYIYQSKQLSEYWGAISYKMINQLKNINFKQANCRQNKEIIQNKIVKVIFDEKAKFTLETVLNFMQDFDPTNKTLLNEITMNMTDIMCPSLFLCDLVSLFDQFKFDITPNNYEYSLLLDARTLCEIFKVFYKNCQTQIEFLAITRKLLYNKQLKLVLQNVLLYIEQNHVINKDYSILITFERIEKEIKVYQIENNQDESILSIQFNKLFAFDQCQCKLNDNQLTLVMRIGQPSKNNISIEEYINNTIDIEGLKMIKDLTLLKQKEKRKQSKKGI